MSDYEHSKCTEKPQRERSKADCRFIQMVREEDRHDQILQNAFLRSTTENPYLRKVNSAIELCAEVKEDQRQKFLEAKRRQQLRENNQELKLLERQLRAAYMRKAASAQIFEKEAIQDKEVARRHNQNQSMEKARLSSEEALKKEREEKEAKKAAFKRDIEEQIAISNATRMRAYKHVLEDKQLMDKYVQKCKEDLEREKRELIEKKIRTRSEIVEYKRSQAEWKLAQSLAKEKENERIAELLRQRELDRQKAIQEKKERDKRKAQISEEIGRQIHEIAMEKARKRDCLAELLVDERQAKEEMAERNELERQRRARVALRHQMQLDFEKKERIKQEQQKLDEEFLEQEMRILAERDKLDQLSDQRRRKKQLEHRKSIQESLSEKQRLKAERMKNILRATELENKEVERGEQFVEEERLRMLKEHVPALLGHLAPGVLRDSDRKLLSILPKQNS